MENIDSNISSSEELVGIDEVQKFLNRSRASVYRYTNCLLYTSDAADDW